MSTATATDAELALPKGSLILVTGANGFIGANIVREALDYGFRVRGTARSQEKADSTVKLFNTANYEAVVVADMEPEGVFDQAVQGVDAILHVASPCSFSPNPHEVVKPAISGALSIMNSALKEPSVKRFVYTSSSSAASPIKPNQKYKIDKDTWNTEVDAYVDFPPPYTPDKAVHVYSASKTKAEQAVWEFVRTRNPHFVVNSVVPSCNIGRVVGEPATSAKMIHLAYQGHIIWEMSPQYLINVIDDARIHLAALVDKSIANQRIFAFNVPFTWNDIFDVYRELSPNMEFPTRPDLPQDLSEVDNQLGVELLRKWWGQNGYTGLKESVRQTMEGLY